MTIGFIAGLFVGLPAGVALFIFIMLKNISQHTARLLLAHAEKRDKLKT